MTYRFRSASGDAVERDYIGDCPESVEIEGQVYEKEAIVFQGGLTVPKEHRAITYAGRDGDKVMKRQYKESLRVAKGLADGSMRQADDRPVSGDKQPREFVRQFNEMYQTAKNG